MKYVLRSGSTRKRSRSKSKRSKKSTERKSKSKNKYHGVTFLSEQLFMIGTIPLRLIPFGMRVIDGVDHILFHVAERVPYRMKKGVINFLLNYGYNILASPLELIPFVGHGIAKSIEHGLFFTKKA